MEEGWILGDGRYFYMRCVRNKKGEAIPAFTVDVNEAKIFKYKNDSLMVSKYIGNQCYLISFKVISNGTDVRLIGDDDD